MDVHRSVVVNIVRNTCGILALILVGIYGAIALTAAMDGPRGVEVPGAIHGLSRAAIAILSLAWLHLWALARQRDQLVAEMHRDVERLLKDEIAAAIAQVDDQFRVLVRDEISALTDRAYRAAMVDRVNGRTPRPRTGNVLQIAPGDS